MPSSASAARAPRPSRLSRLLRPVVAAVFLAQVLGLPAGTAQAPAAAAAGSPGGDAASAWPSAWTALRNSAGTPVYAADGTAPGDLDIASQGGAQPSALYAFNGATAFFRVRLGADPRAFADGAPADGGFAPGMWLANIASASDNVNRVVAGVDGKPAVADYTYVVPAQGGAEARIYTTPFDGSGGQASSGVRVTCADGSSSPAAACTAGTGQVWLDWQVPFARITAASGGAIGASTPVKLFFTTSTSAALNTTAGGDFQTGAVIDFASVLPIAPGAITLAQGKALVSGLNPPRAGDPTVYDVSLSVRNSALPSEDIAGAVVTTVIPDGADIVSVSAGHGSISFSGQTATWSAGSLAAGAAAFTAVIRVRVTPLPGSAGTSAQIAGAASAVGASVGAFPAATGTAQSASPVSAWHPSSVSVDCSAGGGLDYRVSRLCYVTVSDTSSGARTLPAGPVVMTPTAGTSTACALSPTGAYTAACAVSFTPTAAGTAGLAASYGGDADHAAATGSAGALAVAKAVLYVAPDPQSVAFGAAAPAYTFSVSGFSGADTQLSASGYAAPSCASAYTPAAAVADSPMAITCSGGSARDYAFDTSAASTLTIGASAQAPLSLTGVSSPAAYRDTQQLGASGGSGTGAVTYSTGASTACAISGGDTLVITAGTGTCTVTAHRAGDGNYAMASASAPVSVGPAVLAVEPADASVYHGRNTPAYPFSVTGFLNGDTAESAIGFTAPSCASAYAPGDLVADSPMAITCSGGSARDYAFDTSAAAALRVLPAPITIGAIGQASVYGDGDPVFTYSVLGFYDDDSLSAPPVCGVEGPHAAAGSYTITCAGAAADTDGGAPVSPSNYAISYLPGTLDVSPRQVVISPLDYTRTTAEPDPSFGFSADGLAEGDSLSADPVCGVEGAHAAAGIYTVSCSGASAGPDYSLDYAAGHLTVTGAQPQAALAVSGPASAAYGSAHTLAYTGGSGDGNASYDVGGSSACTVFGNQLVMTAGTGTCRVSVRKDGDGEYDAAISPGIAVDVLKAPLAVIPDSLPITFGQSAPAFTFTVTGFIPGEDADTAAGYAPPSCTAAYYVVGASTDLNPFGISCSGGEADDYWFNTGAGAGLTAEPAVVTVTADSRSAAFGDPLPGFGFTATGFYGDDGFTAVPVCAPDGSGVGIWDVTCTGGDAGHDYTIAYIPGTLTVGPTTPGAPRDPAVAPGVREAVLSWSPPASDGGAVITGYLVEWSTDGGATWARTAATADGLRLSDLGDTVTVWFRVRADNGINTEASPWSDTASGTTEALPTPGLTGASWARAVSAAWSAPAAGRVPVSSWRISWSTDGGASWASTILGFAQRSYTIPIDGDGLAVRVRIEARYYSAFSPPRELSLTTLPVPSLAAVRGIRSAATVISAAPSPDRGSPSSFAVAISADGGSTWSSFSSASPVRSITGLADDAGYLLRARARYGTSAWGPWSEPAAVVTPALPAPSLSASGAGRSASVSLSAPSADPLTASPSKYDFEYSGDSGATWTAVNTASSSLLITGLRDSAGYLVRARAAYGSAWGPYSASAAVETDDVATPVLAASAGVRSVTASWPLPATGSPAAATGFRIEVSTNGGSTWSAYWSASPSRTVTGLPDDTVVMLRAMAVYATFTGPAATASVRTPSIPAPVLSASGAVRSALLSWTVPSPAGAAAATAMLAAWSTNGGASWTTAALSAAARSYTVTGIADDAPVAVRVSAVYGPAAASSVSVVRTAPLDPATPSVSTAGWAGAVRATWTVQPTSSTPLLTGFRVRWSTSGGLAWSSSVLGASASAITIQAAGSAADVIVRVAALYGAAEGPAGSAGGTTLPVPSVSAVTGSRSIAVSATAAPAGAVAATSFSFSYSSNGGTTWSSFTGPSSARTFAGLPGSTGYLVRVRVLYGSLWSLYSASAAVSTLP